MWPRRIAGRPRSMRTTRARPRLAREHSGAHIAGLQVQCETMSRAGLAASIACAGCLAAACNKLAELAAPNRDAAAIVFHNLTDTLFVGDSTGAFVDVNDADGRPAKTDTTVVWRTSNPNVVSLDASHPPAPGLRGFSWVYGKSPGQSTVTAQTTKVMASKLVTVIGPGNIAENDQRSGYALADQPTAAGPYSPDPAYRFNSSGGGVTVTRDSTGWYRVRFAGLDRKPGQRDNVQVTAYGAAPGIYCKLLSWGTAGADLLVPVHCHQPGIGGAAVDSRFTILVSGARAYDPSTPFAFAERLPGTQNLQQDTSATSFNSVTGRIQFGRAGVGVYNFVFDGLGGFAGPQSFQATAVGQPTIRCRISNWDFSISVLQAGCNEGDGSAAEGRVSVMWFTRGRVGHRYGFASTNNPGSVTPPIDTAFTFTSSGGPVTSRRVAAGQWTVMFAGLGRPAGATEIVVVSAFRNPDHSCSLVSWSNTGVADLTVTLQCFDATGALLDGRFSVLVIE